MTIIGNYAFYGCSGLTSVTIPKSVTSIGYSAFEGCSGLKSIACKAVNVPTTSDSFDNLYDAVLYVPASSIDAYKAADEWRYFGTILPI